ncbi:UDP-N-acetylmuramate dehydrogenase [Aliikangiella marina]|uniref:UDP-N-acetylmuramate dehydrogenase n=1 Tax=Aliikangiella marina TaxID=1712262 RepID=UPI00163D7ED1|nr:UDP-N-acetylmuramate dehydrogenase [Aliikangiella marina]
MSNIQEFVELRSLNTFNVKSKARFFLQLNSVDEVIGSIETIQQHPKRMVLGGGSNLLFVQDYQGLIIYPQLFGIKTVHEDEESICLAVGASENWHDLVTSTCQQGYYGLENLALIPGTVGASPVQNIGAYGVEIKSFISRVDAVDLDSGEIKHFTNDECQFAYRDSIFKQSKVGRFLITQVLLTLSKRPRLELNYQPLKDYFATKKQVTPQDVYDKVCEVRQEKLPDPKELPNAGSFFKNPVVSVAEYNSLKTQFPDIVAYPNGEDYKLAAGWMIEKAGFKGFVDNKVGVHKKQALVLVNHGDSLGDNVLKLANKVRQSIKTLFQVDLEVEVRVIGGE